MQKHQFIAQVQQNLMAFSAFLDKKIVLNSPYFSQNSGLVSHFVAEIEQTVDALIAQNDDLYLEYYCDKLIKQFDSLNKAIENIPKAKKNVQFHSSFQFSANVHRLSPTERLQEYRKALRALNEKISWLMEQNYNEENAALQRALQDQITETEYRKMKCQKAIEDLEQELQFR